MQTRWKQISRKLRLRQGLRLLFGSVIVLALATDLFDPWVVPIVDRPYGVYRTDFVRDVDRATDIDDLAGSLRMSDDALPMHRWVKRKH